MAKRIKPTKEQRIVTFKRVRRQMLAQVERERAADRERRKPDIISAPPK